MILREKDSSQNQDTMLWIKGVSYSGFPYIKVDKTKQLCDTKQTRKAEIDLSLANEHLKEAISLYASASMNARQHLDNAKEHYAAALLLSEKFISSHYGLFKVAVLEKNYSEAFFQLHAYDAELKGGSDFHLMYQMLMVLLERKENLRQANLGYIQDVKVNYEPLLDNYHLAEFAFTNGDYEKVLKHLIICQNLSEKKGFAIDFFIMIYLARIISSLDKEKKKKALQEAFASAFESGERVMIAHKLLELDSTDFESNFLYMDAYIDLKAYSPLIDSVKRLKGLPATKEESDTLSLYEKLINEVFIETSYLKPIHKALGRGETLRTEALFNEEINCYLNTMETIGIAYPYFYVKIAEAYYEMGDYDKVLQYGNLYFDSGYLHCVRITILLYSIYRQRNESEKSSKIALDCYKKGRMKERGISLNDWMSRLNREYLSRIGRDSSSFQKKHVYLDNFEN